MSCPVETARSLAEAYHADAHEGHGLMLISHVREHAAELAAHRALLAADVSALCDGSHVSLQGCSPEIKWQTIAGTFVALFGL